MNFQSLQKVENPDFYLDIAIKAGKRMAERQAGKTSKKGFEKTKVIELARIKETTDRFEKKLNHILESYPKVDDLDPFYRELVRVTIDYVKLKKSFGAVGWSIRKFKDFERIYSRKIKRTGDKKKLFSLKKEFYGRVSSVVKQIGKQLEFLEETRKTMKKFPSVKTSIPTIAIAGYPNVGKTTLLKLLTSSSPKIASYPFTTQQLMLGYTTINDKKYQIIDTPGLLDRPLHTRNKIEHQAILALRYLAEKIIFLVDASESCGYSVQKQISLLRQIEKQFSLPIILVKSKADLSKGQPTVKELEKAIAVSANSGKGIDKLKKLI